MLNENEARETIGTTAYSSDGEKIGKVGQLFLDDQTGRPEFITVNTGLLGTSESYIPIADATFGDDRLTVPFGKDKVKNAPNVDAEGGHLDPAEEQRLYEYYGLSYDSDVDSGHQSGVQTGTETDTVGHDTTETGHVTPETGRDTTETDTDTGIADRSLSGTDTSGPSTDDAMTRSEEHPQAGTTSQEVGRVRLRKYVTTEEHTVTVPVPQEKAVLDGDGDRDSRS